MAFLDGAWSERRSIVHILMRRRRLPSTRVKSVTLVVSAQKYYTDKVDNIAAILFDWDGTLLDSFPSGFRASMAVFEHFGVSADERYFLTTYNPNWYETYRRVGLPEEEWGTADRIWLEAYHTEPPELYPFTRETLERLHDPIPDGGWRLCCWNVPTAVEFRRFFPALTARPLPNRRTRPASP